MKLDGAIRVRRRKDVLHRLVGNEALLARAGYGEIDVLNGPGAVAWELLAERRSAAELVVLLADVYDVAPDAISEEVIRLVEDLEKRGWLSRDDD